MHSVGFIVRIYHDARPLERQIVITYNIVFPMMNIRCAKHVEDKKN